MDDSGITLKSCIETHNHELFEESLELSPNMINDIISHPHNANISHIGSFLAKNIIGSLPILKFIENSESFTSNLNQMMHLT